MADRQGSAGALSYEPGRDAAERYPDWVIRHRPLGGIPEVLSARRKVILINSSTTWAEKRCSLAHAVAHLDLGHHENPGGVFSRDQERDANLLAAGRLVPVEAFVELLSWTQSMGEIAAELEVDLPTLGHFRKMLMGPRMLHWRRVIEDKYLEAIA